MAENQPHNINQYYLLLEGASKGPFTIHQLRSMWNAGSIHLKTQYKQEGSNDWKPLSEMLDELEPASPSQVAPSSTQNQSSPDQPKSEETLWVGHPSHWHYFWAWVIGILLVGASIAGFFVIPKHTPIVDYSLLAAFIVGVLVILVIHVFRSNRTFTITSRKVIFQSGILVKSSNEIRIRDIRSINVAKHGLPGLLGIGRIEFSSAASDDAEIIFSGVAQADKIRDMVRKLQDEA